MPWDSSEEQMNAPREMRIHVQRVIAIPAPHNMPPPPEGMGPFAPPPPPQHSQDQNEVCNVLFFLVILLLWFKCNYEHQIDVQNVVFHTKDIDN